MRYEQKVASLEYPLRCGLTLKPSLCGIYLLAVLIMAVLSCALCFTETSMNFHKALIDQCSVEIETFGGAFSGLYRESSINILNPPRPTHLGRVVDYCSWENRFSVKIWVKQMQHVWWIPWLVIFHSSFLSERNIDSIFFLKDDDPSIDVMRCLWTPLAVEEKKSLRIPNIKTPPVSPFTLAQL